MNHAEMTAKIATGTGFIAALDQSGGSTPKALRGYGVEDSEWSNDEEMFSKIHAMRCRVVTSSAFTGESILGAILFEKTMEGCMDDGVPVPHKLAAKGIVPFLKVDAGMHDIANGVQLMKDMPRLDTMCARGKELGVFGTKMRSVIHEANAQGVAANVAQQMDFGHQILGNGLMPILEPEVSLASESRAEAEDMVLAAFLEQLERLGDDQKVMLKLTIPVKPNTYKPLVGHPKILRVVALSGGYARDEACTELAKNTGMVASFSRALLNELKATMSDAEFDAALGQAIDEICAASAAG